MDRVGSYLDVVPLPLAVGGSLGVLLIILAIPKHARLYFTLIAMPIWLVLGQLVGLGLIQAWAKVTTVMAYGSVAFAAALHPGPRRRLPWQAILALPLALYSMVFVITARDVRLALVLRFQWLVVVVAAILVVRTVVDSKSLDAVLKWLTVGLCAAMVPPAMALLLDPASAFAGWGRFRPYGASANQIGLVFASAVPFAVYIGTRVERLGWRVIALSTAGLGLAVTTLTGSRSSMLVATAALVPLLVGVAARPQTIVLIVVGGAVGLQGLLGFASSARLERLGDMETRRGEIAVEYLSRSVTQRPYLGLLETEGASVLLDDEILSHPHNAYLEMLYVGGIAYAIPMLLFIGFVLITVVYVWRRRRQLGVNPRAVDLVCVVVVTAYAQGFVNGAIYYPNTTWAFIHALVVTTVVTLSRPKVVSAVSRSRREVAPIGTRRPIRRKLGY